MESKLEVETYLNQFNGGTKRLAQRDYIVNTLEHFRNWYNEQGLDFPDMVLRPKLWIRLNSQKVF